MRRTRRATLRCGRQPSPARRVGYGDRARGGRVGISSARPWRWSTLGDSFDLHAGGEDLMFPHHENEIAQSEAVTHKPLARHWMHVRFLLVDGKKMSKSEGNFYTLRDLLLKGHKASAIRLALISVPYRHQLNFTFEGLAEATNAIDRLRTFHQRLAQGSFEPGETQAIQVARACGAGGVHWGDGERPEYGRRARADLRHAAHGQYRDGSRAVQGRRSRCGAAGAGRL